MRKTISGYISAIVMAFALPLVGHAATETRSSDRQILAKLHFVNIVEIDASELALERACSSSVEAYALYLYDHHSHLDRAVRQLAAVKQVSVNRITFQPWEMANVNKHMAMMKRLENMKTCRFDRQFLITMRDDHNFAAQMISLAIAGERDMQVRGFLTSTLTVIRNHRQIAMDLLKEL